MGLCCGKNTMPIVDDTESSCSEPMQRVVIPTVPIVEFGVVVPNDAPDFAMSLTRSRFGFTMDQSVHTVSDWGVSASGGDGQCFSDTLRDDLSKSFVTNGLSDVLTGQIDRFVNGILQLSSSEAHNILEDNLSNVCSSSSGHRVRGSTSGTLGRLNSLTNEGQLYLERSHSVVECLKRLVEMEETDRQEIFGAWKINTVLFLLALRRVVPTIRRCPASTLQQKGKGRQALVIHAKDIELQMHDAYADVGGHDDDHEDADGVWTKLPASLREKSESRSVHFSPREVDADGDGDADGESSSPPPAAERYQIMALTAREIGITMDVQAKVVKDTWDFLSLPGAADHLNAGNVFFRFVCSPASSLDKQSLDIIGTFINLTGFADEVRENNVPRIDIYSAEEQAKYVGILVKAMYLLPGVRLSHITSELLASLDYQRNCQPGDNKFENCETPYTFRTVKTVIKFVCSVTIQMMVTEITDPEVLRSFLHVDGLVPAKVLLLERTKKNIYKVDSTVKVRSVLLYYPVNDGLLVNSQTIVLNSSLPRLISSLMQTFGSQGAAEAAQTAKLTRQYMIRRFGDARS